MMHFGIALPNHGPTSSPDEILRWTRFAEDEGFDSVWVTEHIIVGDEAVELYGRVYEPLVTLSWVAAQTERVRLGTSITLVPLHHPMHLAKQVATVQELSGGRMTLGMGMGWHKDEFDFMGIDFAGRGKRADEAIRLMRALWAGERSFQGEHWSFEGATFGPVPSVQPELWVGGPSGRAVRRALELGGTWHPTKTSTSHDVARVKREHPELRIIPRTQLQNVDAMLDAGADGAVLYLEGEAEMRAFARAYLSASGVSDA